MSKVKYHSPADKSFEIIREKFPNKSNSARRIIKESRVRGYLALYRHDVNHILARAGEPYVLGLEFEEVKSKEVNLSKFDLISADFVKEVKRKIAFAN